MAGKRIPRELQRVRELQTWRLHARRVPMPLIVQQTGVSERQGWRDLANFRRRYQQEQMGVAAVAEIYEEILRAGWQDHDHARDETARVAALRAVIEAADRVAFTMGVNFRQPAGVNVNMQQIQQQATGIAKPEFDHDGFRRLFEEVIASYRTPTT